MLFLRNRWRQQMEKTRDSARRVDGFRQNDKARHFITMHSRGSAVAERETSQWPEATKMLFLRNRWRQQMEKTRDSARRVDGFRQNDKARHFITMRSRGSAVAERGNLPMARGYQNVVPPEQVAPANGTNTY
jgi:hypothetical protein